MTMRQPHSSRRPTLAAIAVVTLLAGFLGACVQTSRSNADLARYQAQRDEQARTSRNGSD
jgi:ferric-dicitrate binding protein FerR (iron transport regulator)